MQNVCTVYQHHVKVRIKLTDVQPAVEVQDILMVCSDLGILKVRQVESQLQLNLSYIRIHIQVPHGITVTLLIALNGL